MSHLTNLRTDPPTGTADGYASLDSQARHAFDELQVYAMLVKVLVSADVGDTVTLDDTLDWRDRPIRLAVSPADNLMSNLTADLDGGVSGVGFADLKTFATSSLQVLASVGNISIRVSRTDGSLFLYVEASPGSDEVYVIDARPGPTLAVPPDSEVS
ncbi:MAG: hypothetical protein WD534_12555 [Phycisphaeraceae bacterium]